MGSVLADFVLSVSSTSGSRKGHNSNSYSSAVQQGTGLQFYCVIADPTVGK